MSAGAVVSVLGPLRIRTTDGAAAEVRGARLQTLVAVLALAAGREVARSDLLEALWDDDLPSAPDNALQALVSRLRRTLPGLAVESSPTGYRLLVRRDDVDALRFESLVSAVGAARGDPERRAALLRDALALWRGPALAGLTTTGVVRAHATRLEELRRRAREERIDADLARGGAAGLVAELAGLVSEDPLRETSRVQLMRALHAAGRRTEALAVYEDARTQLVEAYGIDPSAELHQAYLDVLRGDRPPPKPRRTVPGRRLPVPLTELVGREADVERIQELLGRARLVTVAGPGGVGKTRVALESARRIGESGTGHHVFLAELATVTDPVNVPRAILDATGAGEAGLLSAPGFETVRGAVLRRLTGLLAEERALLVLDNCEHVVGAVSETATGLLAQCPDLRVLGTSRQPLGVSGERLHHLHGLALPRRTADAADSPAVRLFTDRATAVRPAFALDERTVEPVVAICRALDGQPLALELAAARLLSLSVGQIRDRLDDRFRLLGSEGATTDVRQRTLRAVMDWTWDLLDDAERTLARRLAVFVGRVDLTLIERVCAGEGLDAADLDPLLSALVAKSVVQTEETAEADGRIGYRMPETVRLYAAEQLAAAGDETALRLRHARTLLSIAESAEPKLRRIGQSAELAALTGLLDDFHAALRWSVDAAPPELALRLVASLEWFWLLSGRRAESMEWTRRALAVPCGTRPVERAIVCAVGGLRGGALLGQQEGVGHLFEALALIQDLNERNQEGADHPVLVLAAVLGPLASGAPELVREQLRALNGHRDPWIASFARMLGARMLANAGQPHAARDELRAALDGFRTIGERLGLTYTLSALAEAESARGDHVAAIGAIEEALRAVTELGVAEDRPMLMVRLAVEHARAVGSDRAEADPAELGPAEAGLVEAAAEASRLGLGEVLGVAHLALGDLHRTGGSLVEARRVLDRALAEVTAHGTGIGYRPAVLTSRGHLAVAEGRLPAALEACTTALELARQVDEAQLTARVLVLAADIALARAEPESAAVLLRTAAAVRGQRLDADPDVRRIARTTRAALGDDRYEAARPVALDGIEPLVVGLSARPVLPPVP
ncbi:BTAD domain-containing putative transcriptional regulator [Streptomyces aurantiacus]|uniref:SARP family transcriptional regulator n=1 Tax=Streptomyces aurantiacus TaxID=47760 RepID=A0A7G1PD71_9ACTN|nr:BTAD domain-containing putative transcriptional regulator [Streptomyces aurantiacus]BCL32501.1 SARP family transcriptional regulator [Streptomyces aurantiacus]